MVVTSKTKTLQKEEMKKGNKKKGKEQDLNGRKENKENIKKKPNTVFMYFAWSWSVFGRVAKNLSFNNVSRGATLPKTLEYQGKSLVLGPCQRKSTKGLYTSSFLLLVVMASNLIASSYY